MKRYLYLLGFVLSVGLFAACGKDNNNQAQQPVPQYPQCAAGTQFDPRYGQCVSVNTAPQGQQQQYQGTLQIRSFEMYRTFLKDYTSSGLYYCRYLTWNGWKPSFQDCYNAFVGGQATANIRFANFITTGSQVQMSLTSGTGYNAVQLPLALAFYTTQDNTMFDLRAEGVPGTPSWNDQLSVKSARITFDSPNGKINDTQIQISIIYKGVEIAGGTVTRF